MIRTVSRCAALLACCFLTAVHAAPPATPLPIKHMYVLGDSLSDQGNLLIASTTLSGGTIALPRPDFYQQGRFSNGENYAGLLAKKLGFTLAPSEAGGTNFAFGGSRTSYNRVEARPNVPPPLPTGPFPIGAYPWSLNLQRVAFLDAALLREADPTGLYVVFAGSNDLSDALTALLFHGTDPAPTIASAVQGVAETVLDFKAAGARNVLVLNMPNLGLVPSVTQFGPAVAGLATSMSQQFNVALAQALGAIGGMNIIAFDTFAFFNDLVANPGDYGLTNVSQPCFTGFVDQPGTVCPNPDEYAFWDVEHPTTRLHAILADALYTAALKCTSNGRGRARCAIDAH